MSMLNSLAKFSRVLLGLSKRFFSNFLLDGYACNGNYDEHHSKQGQSETFDHSLGSIFIINNYILSPNQLHIS